MSDEPERVRRIRNERESIEAKGATERGEAVVTVSKTDRFKAGLSRIKEGVSHVGHEAKEQLSNPESGTRKVASDFKRGGQAVVGGARKVANTETFKRVSANSVDLVRGTDNGLLNVHSEQRSRSKNSNMNRMFSQDLGEPIHPLAGIGNVGGGFSIFGEGRRTQRTVHKQGSKHKSRAHQTIVKETHFSHGKRIEVTRTYSGQSNRRKKGRRKRKREPAQSTWSPF